MDESASMLHLESTYENCAFPVLLLDGELMIRWSNTAAKKVFPVFSHIYGFRLLSGELSTSFQQSLPGANQPVILQLDISEEKSYSICLTPVLTSEIPYFVAVFSPGDHSAFPSLSSEAYQIRESLFYIGPALDRLSLLLEENDIAQGSEYLNTIARSSMQILRHLRLLTLYRELASGKQADNALDCVDLCDFCEQSCVAVRNITAHLGVDLRWAFPYIPLVIRAESERLSTLIFTLLATALEGCEKGDSVKVTLHKKGNQAHFTIWCDGSFEPGTLADAFTANPPLFSDKPIAQSLSLELSVAKLITVELKGNMTITQTDGGYSLLIVFPLVKNDGIVELNQTANDYVDDRLSSAYIFLSNLSITPY